METSTSGWRKKHELTLTGDQLNKLAAIQQYLAPHCSLPQIAQTLLALEIEQVCDTGTDLLPVVAARLPGRPSERERARRNARRLSALFEAMTRGFPLS